MCCLSWLCQNFEIISDICVKRQLHQVMIYLRIHHLEAASTRRCPRTQIWRCVKMETSGLHIIGCVTCPTRSSAILSKYKDISNQAIQCYDHKKRAEQNIGPWHHVAHRQSVGKQSDEHSYCVATTLWVSFKKEVEAVPTNLEVWPFTVWQGNHRTRHHWSKSRTYPQTISPKQEASPDQQMQAWSHAWQQLQTSL